MELQKVVDRLGDLFEKEVYRALDLVLSLPDSDYKHDMLHVSILSSKMIRFLSALCS